ncbi:MAG: chromosomal replication initiator protein DnaA [Acidimicrobiia bacterium]
MNEAEHLWTSVAQILRAQVSEAVWLSSFQDVRALSIVDNQLFVVVASSYVRDRIEGRYLALVRDALGEVGRPDLHLHIQVQVDDSAPVVERIPDAVAPAQQRSAEEPTSVGIRSADTRASDDGLNPKYTFEAFVTGQSNRFAHAAALRVAETPAKSYNPLFIYGAAGLGKTHLLHAIGHYVHQNYAHYTVRYVSTETFLNEYVDAIRTNTTAMFKRRYREIDVLMIDDIQFMEGKEGLQEEFFHTFNSLHGASRQIVISSDRQPDAIPTLEDRLRGRFKWGLITDIQPPDLETRLAILRNKAEREAAPIPSDVLEFIATNITNNIRELEGALIRVSAYASLNREALTVPMAEKVLSDILSDHQPRAQSPAEMLQTIADFFNFQVDQIRGKSRHRPLVTARQIGMYVFRELTDLSYPDIAREFGGRDHTTVIHAVQKISALMRERQQIYDQVTELIQTIKSPK